MEQYMDHIYDDQKFADFLLRETWRMGNEPSFQKFLMDQINLYEESERYRNETIGENQAVQELSRRDKLDSEKSKKTEKKEKEIFLWITINPKQTTTLAELQKLVHKMYDKIWIKNKYYIFEISENGHAHSHGLLRLENYTYKRAVKELSSSVHKICDTDNGHCFKVVPLEKDIAKQKYLYMQGLKQSKKLRGVAQSKTWRATNSIKEFYGESLTLLDPPSI